MKLSVFYLTTLAALITAVDDKLSRLLEIGNKLFTARMFDEIVDEKPDKSVVMSGYSVLTPLAQLALASEGESRDELLSTIGMPNDIITKAVFSQAEDRIKSVQGVELKTASKIYVAKYYELNDDFAADTRAIFNSEVEKIDFSKNLQAANEINFWVEEQTNRKIKDLVDANSLNNATRALLVNAIYFKGLWKLPFNKEKTTYKDFYVTKKNTEKVPMMSQKAVFNYADDRELKAQILEMSYEGDQASIIIVLPHKIEGIAQLEKKLRDPSTLDNALDNKSKTLVYVTIPKFRIESTTDLKEVLEKMGLKRIFTPGSAQLNNLLKDDKNDIYVNGAIQKAFIVVDEEGSEAGAANVFDHFISPLLEPEATYFIADRPFYFEIRAKGVPLFSGVKVK